LYMELCKVYEKAKIWDAARGNATLQESALQRLLGGVEGRGARDPVWAPWGEGN
jgi:hypothetical protein